MDKAAPPAVLQTGRYQVHDAPQTPANNEPAHTGALSAPVEWNYHGTIIFIGKEYAAQCATEELAKYIVGALQALQFSPSAERPDWLEGWDEAGKLLLPAFQVEASER